MWYYSRKSGNCFIFSMFISILSFEIHYQEGESWNPTNQFNPSTLNDICVPVSSQDLDCQGHVSLSFCVQCLRWYVFFMELLTLIVKLAFHNLISKDANNGMRDTLCDKVCQRLVACLWFSPCITVSTTNKTDPHDITAILLKVAFLSQPIPAMSDQYDIYSYISNSLIHWCLTFYHYIFF